MNILFCFLVLTISLLLLKSSGDEFKSESQIIATEWGEIGINSFNKELAEIENALNEFMTASFNVSLLKQIFGDSTPPAYINNGLQIAMWKVENASKLVSAFFLLDTNNNIYNVYDHYLYSAEDITDFEKLKDIKQRDIVYLESSPFDQGSSVFALIMPFSDFSFYLERSFRSQPKLFAIILLDSEEVMKILDINNTSFFESCTDIIYRGNRIYTSEKNFANTYSFVLETDIPSLEIEYFVDEDTYPTVGTIFIVSLVFGLIFVLVCGSLLIWIISNKLTKPLSDMTEAIEKISNRTYDLSLKSKYNDETGILSDNINKMYQTLNKQFDIIKEEEALKYKFKFQMLSEQINPHFIYNTLEIINMEVLSGNTETAATMIQYFAKFLRYSLNQGEDSTSLENEVDYVSTYINIMNIRQSGTLDFKYTIEEGLQSYSLPKSTLLPLVENAIKHGFNNSYNCIGISIPHIYISAKLIDGMIHLVVSDNGVGIDIVKAQNSLYSEDNQIGHFGLGNIYSRLKLYFDEVDVKFSSIPYYENNVEIILPLEKKTSFISKDNANINQIE